MGGRVAVALGVLAMLPATAVAQSAPDAGRPFEPQPLSQPLYDVRSPQDDPVRQRLRVPAADGATLFVEAWLPKAKGAAVPPAQVPVVVILSPYHALGRPAYVSSGQEVIDLYTRRGYAVVHAHARGTGESDGCFENISALDADDGARIFEFLGRDAPWSNGRVGVLGLSQAGARPAAGAMQPRAQPWLRAMVLLAPVISRYATSAFDGVPYSLDAFVTEISQFQRARPARDPARWPGDLPCLARHAPQALDFTGNMTPYLSEREWRRDAQRIEAPVLYVHGHRDSDVEPIAARGFFDRLGGPRAGVFGVFDHEFPDAHNSGVRREWERTDWAAMTLAWFDRHLRNLPTGVEDWPVAQVQSNDGQWRAEPDWPRISGTPGQLALGPRGALGTTAPAGATSYQELGGFAATGAPPGTSARFVTAPLPGRLELTGQALLDMWVRLQRPDGHVAARLTALDAAGTPMPHGEVEGFRSVRHLAPLVDGRFEQRSGVAPPVGRPVRVPVRFQPGSLVVPPGGRLALEIAGTQQIGAGIEGAAGASPVIGQPSWPSLSLARITVLHDCQHPTTLRFTVPGTQLDLLNVRERDEGDGPLADLTGTPAPDSSGGGLAHRPVCGVAPIEPSLAGAP